MAEVGSITIPIRVEVDPETAATCARVVEMYVNQTGSDLMVHRLPGGRYTLTIVETDHDA
jgi:hypothetical protein